MQMVQADAQFQILCVSRLQYRSRLSLPLQRCASKAAWGHGKGNSMGSCAQGNLNLQKCLSQADSLNCSVKNVQLHTHTHTHIFFMCVLSSPGSSLYCSFLIFRLRSCGEGKRQNRGRTQGDVPHTQSRCTHLAAPKQGEGCRERGRGAHLERGQHLAGESPPSPKHLGQCRAAGLGSGAWAAKWVFNIYLKE